MDVDVSLSCGLRNAVKTKEPLIIDRPNTNQVPDLSSANVLTALIMMMKLKTSYLK